MRAATWQRLMAVAIVLTVAHILTDFGGGFVTGETGYRFAPAGTSLIWFRVVSVDEPNPGSALHAGDEVRLADASLAQRERYFNARAGDVVTYVKRDGTRVNVRRVFRPPGVPEYVYMFLRLAMTGIALIIVLRRPDRRETRTLAQFLTIFACSLEQAPQPFFPDAAVAFLWFGQQYAVILALSQAVRLATVFPDPAASGVRGVLRRINPVVTGVVLATATLAVARSYIALVPPPEPLTMWLSIVAMLYYIGAMTAAFWIANLRSTPEEKRRVAWVSYSLAAGFSGLFATIPLQAAFGYGWWSELLPLTLLAIPAGLAYAMLRHRVIDVGFVLNRAVVFALVSAIVVLAFGSLEWLLGQYLTHLSHATSAWLELGLALALGASLRPIHRRIEAFADEAFFRDRHRAVAALRRYALDVQYVTELRVVLARTIEEVCVHAGAAGAALYVAESGAYGRAAGGSAFPDTIDENDPLFVRLRATREQQRAHGLGSVLEAEIALPFVVRGALSGALVCSAKRNGEAYAPDEVAALIEIARSVGIAHDALSTAALRREIDALLDAYPALGEARGLPQLPGAAAP